MALAMLDRFGGLRARWMKQGYDLDLSIGIAKGFATLGAFGFEGRFDYSAIGSVVNLCGPAVRRVAAGPDRDRPARARRARRRVRRRAYRPARAQRLRQPVPAFVLTRKA